MNNNQNNDNNKYNLDENPQIKKVLRVLGPIILGIGILLIVIGFGEMFFLIGSFRSPRLFFLGFIGMPLSFVGSVMTSYGYMGNVARYQASQMAPIKKDVVNYMVDGTKESIQTVASSIAGAIKPDESKFNCPHCQKLITKDMKFCDNCGKPLTINCNLCQSPNSSDAKYCKNCGEKLSN